MADTLRQLRTLMETATVLGISPHTVRKLIRIGRLRPTRICRRILVSEDEINRFIAGAQ